MMPCFASLETCPQVRFFFSVFSVASCYLSASMHPPFPKAAGLTETVIAAALWQRRKDCK
jgi:hypothetical protein